MSVDIAILGKPGSPKPASLVFNNTVCTGTYKLVQRVLIELFTDSTNPFSFGEGTEIPSLLSGTNAIDDDQLQQFFNIAGAEVKELFLAQDVTGVPANEILSDIRFTVVQPENQLPDTRTIEVFVLSEAGEETTVEVPITFEATI